jgi:hypothetical protein
MRAARVFAPRVCFYGFYGFDTLPSVDLRR